MAEIVWPSLADKLEAIGYLAIPGVVSAIEATVPKGKSDKFIEEYKNKFSDVYRPYEADKFGYQFRIYLNDLDGCPEFLKSVLDNAYGNRINNTEFIAELVNEYGFIFTRGIQNSKQIRDVTFAKHKRPEFDAFEKGFSVYRDFVQKIENYIKGDTVVSPNSIEFVEKTIKRKSNTKSASKSDSISAFTPNQLLKLGWVGEQYIYDLLIKHDSVLVEAADLPKELNYEVEWFNKGVQDAEENISIPDISSVFYEYVKKWDDKSVGKGCDLIMTFENDEKYYIEVKTSKRLNPFFSMTSVEMQEMEERGDNYIIIKVNNIERLLEGKSPDIIVIRNPFKKLFHPEQMKDATFIIGGNAK